MDGENTQGSADQILTMVLSSYKLLPGHLAVSLFQNRWECLFVQCGAVHSGRSPTFEQKRIPQPFFSVRIAPI